MGDKERLLPQFNWSTNIFRLSGREDCNSRNLNLNKDIFTYIFYFTLPNLINAATPKAFKYRLNRFWSQNLFTIQTSLEHTNGKPREPTADQGARLEYRGAPPPPISYVEDSLNFFKTSTTPHRGAWCLPSLSLGGIYNKKLRNLKVRRANSSYFPWNFVPNLNRYSLSTYLGPWVLHRAY